MPRTMEESHDLGHHGHPHGFRPRCPKCKQRAWEASERATETLLNEGLHPSGHTGAIFARRHQELVAAELGGAPAAARLPAALNTRRGRELVEWIVYNDNAGDNEPPEALAGYVSVVMLAHVYGVNALELGRWIWAERNPMGGR